MKEKIKSIFLYILSIVLWSIFISLILGGILC